MCVGVLRVVCWEGVGDDVWCCLVGCGVCVVCMCCVGGGGV